ncbi:MAG: methionyl-tRNA formyltransferase [Fibrobacterota bacterium]
MAPLRIVFMGTPEFALPSLEALRNGPQTVVAVVTRPDAPKGRGRHLSESPVKAAGLAAGLPVLQPYSLKDPGFLSALRVLLPDLLVVVAFKILPDEVLSIPSLGAVNLHASLLPKYRGAAPIKWAIARGETQTGITVFMLNRIVDGGAVIRREALDIGPRENAGELSARLSALGARVLCESVDALACGEARPELQDEGGATPAPKLAKEDGKIDFTRSAREIYNWIRGMTPAPGAFTFLNGRRLQVLEAELCEDESNGRPGTIASVGSNGLVVRTGAGKLAITAVKPENRKAMWVCDFLNGVRINENDAFDA